MNLVMAQEQIRQYALRRMQGNCGDPHTFACVFFVLLSKLAVAFREYYERRIFNEIEFDVYSGGDSRMKSIIKELYRGNLAPADKPLWKNPKLKKLMDQSGDLEDQLDAMMEGEAKKLFEEYCTLQTDIAILNGEERFTDGFKMGMRMALESLADDKEKQSEV